MRESIVVLGAGGFGIGIPPVHAGADEFATRYGREPATLVHPQSSIEMDVDLAPGCLVLPGARMQTGTSLGASCPGQLERPGRARLHRWRTMLCSARYRCSRAEPGSASGS